MESLFEPRSIAIVGASADPMKWGHWAARDALEDADRRAVYLVNGRGGDVLGQPAYRSMAELPEPPDLVVLAVPAAVVEDALGESLEAGARALVVITAGFGEESEEGLARERAMAERVRDAGALMLGPNCLGVADTGAGLSIGLPRLPAGGIGLACQSGNLALELSRLAADAGVGFSRVASIGNQADVEAADLVTELAGHSATTVIALYVEDFRHGRQLAAAMHAAGKPVIVLAAGESAAGSRAAASHTGALVSDLAVVDAACRAAGAIRVSSPAEMIDVAQLAAGGAMPTGRCVAVVSDGGGHAVIAADLAAQAGLEVPALSDGVRKRLLDSLPGRPVTANPIDLAGAGEQDLASYERVVSELVNACEIDAALLTGYFGGYSVDAPEAGEREAEVAAAMARAAAGGGLPLIVHTMYPASASVAVLRDAGVPVYPTIDAATSALGRAAATHAPSEDGIPQLPEADPPVAGEGYWTARELLAAAGLRFAEARRASTPTAALIAAGELGYPVALKATGSLHKSDAGGVALGLADEAELLAALEGMASLGGDRSVERMAALDAGVELLVGARRDPRFGPVVAVGLGGLWVEVLDDVALALAPVAEGAALEMLKSLRGAPLMAGARGRARLDLAAAAAAVARLSEVAAAHPELTEIEVNPLLVTPAGALGLDARIIPTETTGARPWT
jgi:acyl-CoA synthetase (NDP forming)